MPGWILEQEVPMIDLDFELDPPVDQLELEWRGAQKATLAARAHHQAVAKRLRALADLFEAASERLDILEILEARSLARMNAHRVKHETSPAMA